MTHTLFHPLRILWNERVALFWPIWVSLTAAGLLLVSLLTWGGIEQQPAESKTTPRAWSRADKWALGALSALLIVFAIGSFVWEDFTYYDNSHFTNETLQGHSVAIQISSYSGRFWPLGYQEFNLVRHITSSIIGYHAIRVIELLVMCAVLLALDRALNLRERVTLILVLLVTPSIVIIFSGLIYSEANVIAGFACLLWCVSRFQEAGKKRWAIGAVLFAQVVLYYKETAFLLVGGMAVGDMICRSFERYASQGRFLSFRDPKIQLDMVLIALVAVFLLYYRAAMYPIFGMGYGEQSKIPFAQVLLSDIRVDILAWVFVAVALVRFYLVARSRVNVWPLWDGLALAGVATFAAYLYLQMASGYYLAPIDFISVLYLGRIAFLGKRGLVHTARWVVVALIGIVILQDVSLSAFRVYEAKNTIHGKAEEGQAIALLYRTHPEKLKKLFFPYANAFDILEFGAYLNYLGVPIEQKGQGGAQRSVVELAGRSILTDGPCGYRTFICHPESEPRAGDLVVILPDDPKVANASVSGSAKVGAPLITYSPAPRIPEWMEVYVAPLHVISPEFAFTGLPPGWLCGSVVFWR